MSKCKYKNAERILWGLILKVGLENITDSLPLWYIQVNVLYKTKLSHVSGKEIKILCFMN